MRVADSTVLYALADGSDAHHAAAKALLSDPEPVVVPGAVLVETMELVLHRMGEETARAALRAFLALPHLTVAPVADVDEVQRIHEEFVGELSLADAFVMHAARSLGAAPLTFDARMRAALG